MSDGETKIEALLRGLCIDEDVSDEEWDRLYGPNRIKNQNVPIYIGILAIVLSIMPLAFIVGFGAQNSFGVLIILSPVIFAILSILYGVYYLYKDSDENYKKYHVIAIILGIISLICYSFWFRIFSDISY